MSNTTESSERVAAKTEAPIRLVVIAASMGGIHALREVLKHLPVDFPVPIAIVQHRSATQPNYLPEVLGRATRLPVTIAEEGERLRAGHVYLAPPTLHMTVAPDLRVSLQDGRKIRHLRSSANPLFSSAAEALGVGVLGVVLTGGDRDATDGVQAIRDGGGLVIAQDEATSEVFAMPASAIATGSVSRVLPLSEIGSAIVRLAERGRAR